MEDKSIETKEAEKCQLSARYLDWESGIIRSIGDTIRECDKVDTCNFKCKCMLREAYHFYLNEQYRRDKDLE